MAKDISYYEKLGFDKMELWSEENLANFLIWDCFEAWTKEGYCDVQKFILDEIQTISRKNETIKYQIVTLILDIFNKLLQRPGRKNEVLIFDLSKKYYPNILKIKKKYRIAALARGVRDRLFFAKNFIVTESFSDANQLLCDYVAKRDKKYLYDMISQAKNAIKKANPGFVVLGGDFSFASKAIIFAAKNLGVPTILLQQSLIQEYGCSFFGKTADYAFVWGEYFKELLIKNNKNADNVYVTGYPYLISRKPPVRKDKYTVYCLGEDYENYNSSCLPIKIKTIKEINKICKKLGMDFIYRPHPSENRAAFEKDLSEIHFCSVREKIEESLREGDIFISSNSTSLVEAALVSKIALQLKNYPIISDNFEKLGICNKTFRTAEELGKYLEKIASANSLEEFLIKFDNYYAETRYNSQERFFEILNKIKTEIK